MDHKSVAAAKQLIGVMYQRAAVDGRDGDAADLQNIWDQLRVLGQVMVAMKLALRAKSEALDTARADHDALLRAVLNADEGHPLIGELAHTVRQEEWAEAEALGHMTPNDLAERLNQVTDYADDEAVALFVRMLTESDVIVDEVTARTLLSLMRDIAEAESS